VSLADRRLTGFEALIRWNHAQRGLVPPATFIPIAEESGLITDLGDWVTHAACRQMRACRTGSGRGRR
jgi:EAL domain-containing protein (putative c-di-GMP-specific phosphodiesterase class I)